MEFTHIDNIITIGEFVCDLQEFLLYEPDYALPNGIVEQNYDQGESYTVKDRDGVEYKLPLPWIDGDFYISRSNVYKFIRQRRLGQIQDAATLNEVKLNRVSDMSGKTYAYIANKMPDWRLNRWKAYYTYTMKIATSGFDSLNLLEQAEYNCFPDPSETHEQCAQYVPVALQWVVGCIIAHGTAAEAIRTAQSIDELNSIGAPTYPPWPL